MRRLAPFLVLLLAACAGARAPGASRSAPSQPAVLLAPDGAAEVRVRVEVARTGAEVQRGLMYRERLAPETGMLFLFDRPSHHTFWMRNTYVSLDMIFIRADRRVLGVVEGTEPLTDDPRSVAGESQFVLEVPAGFAVGHRIAPGTRVTFIDID